MAEAEQKEVGEVKKEEAVEVKKEEVVEKEEKKTTEREKTGVEQVFTIPLRKAKSVPRWKRSNKAIKVIKAYLARHLKAEENKIHIDASINEKIWSRGSQKPPIQIRVRAMKFEDGVVEAELIE